jgi:hypothetical protein
MEVTSRDGLVELLGASIGPDEARAAVDREADGLNLGRNLTTAEGYEVLRRVEDSGGPAGLAARIALRRLQRTSPVQASGQFRAVSPGEGPVDVAEIERLLAIGLGTPRARELVVQAMGLLGVAGRVLEREDAARVLDAIGDTNPSMASYARFAKVKILLR